MPLKSSQCPQCGKRAAFLWLYRGRKGFCDECWSAQPDADEREWESEILLGAKIGEDGEWQGDGDYEFKDLAAYLNGKDPLGCDTISKAARGRLIVMLERLIPRAPVLDEKQIARFEQLSRRLEVLREKTKSIEWILLPQNSEAKTGVKKAIANMEAELEKIVQSVRATVKAQRAFSDEVERRIYKRLKDAHDRPLPRPNDEPWLSRAERVYWQLLPPSHDFPGSFADWETIERYLELVTQRTGEQLEKERLRFLWEFKPDRIYVGSDEFEGYFVFLFEEKGRAFLECPKIGNALFVMNAGEWRFLSRKSKSELMRDRSVRRIPHLGGAWKRKVRRVLTYSVDLQRLFEKLGLTPGLTK